ncbi:MAG: flagellar capping protein [Lachnospiraceae bacterium]|nr:flagellar capping protein [Lachnospiraceae bacterium]MBR5760511.1 flagellar capping protein [Lachnospiraceae bacterium]
MAAIDTIYNYYLSTYGNNTYNRYDTHKKSELRSIYNQMVKVNKNTPLYKVLGVEEGNASEFAIDLKESSLNLEKTAHSLSAPDDVKKGLFKKKVAASSDEDHVAVNYVGDGDSSELTDTFTLSVKNLATGQVNKGNYLDPARKDFKEGVYTFDLQNTSSTYEFQFTVSDKDTNKNVEEKLAKLINTANIGVDANIEKAEDGREALVLSSKETGLTDDEKFLFNITPGPDPGSRTAVEILGIDAITEDAKSSTFILNGAEHHSLANKFTINREFEITLKDVHEDGEAATVGFENDVDAIMENVSRLVNAFNSTLAVADKYNSSSTQSSSKLQHDLAAISNGMRDRLESMGLMVQNNGSVVINRDSLSAAVKADSTGAIFSELNSFKNAAAARASQISINPVDYMNKVVVAYKNPGREFSAPYATSMYAGLMMDTYM